MVRKLCNAVAALALVAGLAACVEGQGNIERTLGAFDPIEVRTLIGGAPPEVAFGTEAQFRASMDVLGQPCPANVKPGTCLRDLRMQNGQKGSATLKNLGGAPGRAMVGWHQGGASTFAIADLALDMQGDFAGPPANYRVKGRIMQTCEDGTPGYKFVWNGNTGSPGTLDLCHTTYTTTHVGQANERTFAIQMKIRIDAAARVDPKDTSDPSNVFPNAAAATGIRLDSIKAALFNFKLYAAGTDIHINKIWVDRNYDPAHPHFVEIPDTSAAFAFMYETSPEACIDMMFQNSPPMSLQPTDVPPFYCLGRCKAYPSLINTF